MELISTVLTPGNISYFLDGLLTTLQFAVISIFFSFLLGTVLALVINYAPKAIAYLGTMFIEIYRNTPLLLWILFGRFGITKGFGLPPYTAVMLMFVFFFSAIICETMRSGLNAISKGQYEAAASQGFNFPQTLAYIVLPQAIRAVTPQLLSTLITIIKDTSFLATISIADLIYQGRAVMAQYTTIPEKVFTYGVLIMIYFTVNFSLSLLVRYLSKPGRGRKTAKTNIEMG